MDNISRLKRIRILLVLTALTAAAPPRTSAQSTDQSALTFDAASIKPSDPTHIGAQVYSPGPGRFTAMTAPVKNLVAFAYKVRDLQLSGAPRWAETEPWDISAEAPGHPTIDELRLMVQNLLADRFHLKLHHELKELAVYDLVVGRKGAILKEVDKPGHGVSPGKDRIFGVGGNMATLASVLTGTVGRMVRDRTDLKGFYDFNLTWAPDDASEPGASIFTALQEQLGLKLEPSKGPVDTLVIDAVTRPSAN